MLPAGRLEPLRRASTCLGRVAAAATTAGASMFAVACLAGVHCPVCAFAGRSELAALAWWTTYFAVKDTMLGAGALLGLIALPLAQRRRAAWLAIGLGLVVLACQPL